MGLPLLPGTLKRYPTGSRSYIARQQNHDVANHTRAGACSALQKNRIDSLQSVVRTWTSGRRAACGEPASDHSTERCGTRTKRQTFAVSHMFSYINTFKYITELLNSTHARSDCRAHNRDKPWWHVFSLHTSPTRRTKRQPVKPTYQRCDS